MDTPTFNVTLCRDGKVTVSVRGVSETMTLGEWSKRIASPTKEPSPSVRVAGGTN